MDLRKVFRTWWPLAASWLVMSIELPLLSAVVARLPEPEINLAAYGGVVFPLSLIIEAPIIMLLSASTALCKDWQSYQRVRTYMMSAGAILTGLHILVAFTPLFDVVTRQILGVPEQIIEPARLGLMVMTPWTWSIGYRRFNQGVMIRFGHSGAVGAGTLVRLAVIVSVLAGGYLLGNVPGIVVGASAAAGGVLSEALYVAWRVRPVLRQQVRPAAPAEPLTWEAFYRFYIPLALTSFLTLVWQPIGSAALSRMPMPIESLAVWPVVSGLVFLFRSFGISFNEVVVALLDTPGSTASLRRFTILLSAATTTAHFLMAVTPLSTIWFGLLSGLRPELAELAVMGLLLALPLPALNTLQSWYQGAILYDRRTRGIPESVGIFLVTVLVVLGAGLLWGQVVGLYIGMTGFVLANLTQTIWLGVRSRPALAIVQARDGGQAIETVVPNKLKNAEP